MELQNVKKKKRKVKPIVRVSKERHMVVTPVARLSFPNLFVAKSFKDELDAKKTFHCDLIFDSKDALKESYKSKKGQTPSLLQAIRFAKEDQWGSPDEWPEFSHDVILDGNERTIGDGDDVLEGYKDKFYIKPRTGENYPPKLYLPNGKPATEEDLYGGCYVRAQILVRPYDTSTNAGVSLRLVSILKVKDGEKFGVGDTLFDFSDGEAHESDSMFDFKDDEDVCL